MSYDFTPSPNATIAETIRDFFNYLSPNYKATIEGCTAIEDEWQRNKKRFDDLFKDTEGYDPEAHAIVIDTKFYRKINAGAISKFFEFVSYCIPPYKDAYYDGKTVDEWENKCNSLDVLLRNLRRVRKYINPHAYTEVYEEYKSVEKYVNYDRYDPESVKLRNREISFCEYMKGYKLQFVDDMCKEKLDDLFPEAKVAVGTKTSKVVRKILTKYFRYKFVENEHFESEYAKYADAINPIEIPRKTIISWHIMDYLTASFGVSWTSCMTPDKDNKHNYFGRTADYRGCYSSGTLSYGLDDVTLVLYTVSSDAQKPYWNLPKIDRQLFHISKGGTTIIQGRHYPYDQTDAGNSMDYEEYKPNRLLIQSIVSKAYGFDNLWKNKRGTDYCEEFIEYSHGTHYCDYSCYDNCNVSYLPNTRQLISIGHDPICPSCGEEHDEKEWCTCEDCREGEVCVKCGRRHRRDDMRLIDGDYYCDDCAFYCNHHGEYEIGDSTYIDGYGNVCEDGFNSLLSAGKIHKDAYTGDWFYKGSGCYTLTIDDTGEFLFFLNSYHRMRWRESHRDVSVTIN